MLDPVAKGLVIADLDQMKRVYATARAPLGQTVQRQELGSYGGQSGSGRPFGLYRGTTFRTKFESGTCHEEAVTVRATDEIEWRIFDHMISTQPVPCPAKTVTSTSAAPTSSEPSQ